VGTDGDGGRVYPAISVNIRVNPTKKLLGNGGPSGEMLVAGFWMRDAEHNRYSETVERPANRGESK